MSNLNTELFAEISEAQQEVVAGGSTFSGVQDTSGVSSIALGEVSGGLLITPFGGLALGGGAGLAGMTEIMQNTTIDAAS